MDLHMKQKLDTVTVFDLMNNSFLYPRLSTWLQVDTS